MFQLKLFGTAGIRMIYPDELNPELALRIGNAIGQLGLSNTAYIIHDTRTTSPLISLLISAGLMSTGTIVYHGGIAPTPVVAYKARKEKAIGISVTASHNPPEYNGVKIYDVEGYEFTRDLEATVEKCVESPNYVKWNKVGGLIELRDLSREYSEALAHFIGEVKPRWKPNIAIDCANGAAFNISPSIIRMLGAVPYTFNCNPDGYFLSRPPEPRRDALEKMLPAYSSVNPAVVFAHDGDADRVAILDPTKGFIRQDRVLAYFAKKILEVKKGHVIISIDTGFVVDDVVYEMGGSVERYVLGKTHEKVKELGLSNVVMAGEPWKLIYTSWGPWVDGILQVALITKAIVESGKPFTKLLDEERIPDYPWDRRSYVIEPANIRNMVFEEVVEEIEHSLGDPIKVIRIDGYRFEYKDNSWLLLRKSGTEPKIRIYAEAREASRLKEIIERAENTIIKIVKKHGGKITEITIG
ncbi:MAG: phosphoglucomutase [Desulfurococcaceae archaeon]